MFQAESAGEAPPPRTGRSWPRSVAFGLMVAALAGLVGGAVWLVGSESWLHAPWEDNRRSPLSSLLDLALAEPARPTAPPTRPTITPAPTDNPVVAPPEATPTTTEPTATPTSAPPMAAPTTRAAPPPSTTVPVQAERPRQRRAETAVAIQPSATATSVSGPPVVIAPALTPLLAPPAATPTLPPTLIRPGPLRAAAATARALGTPVRQRQPATP